MLSMAQGASWARSKVISLRSRLQCTLSLYHCPGHNTCQPCWIWINISRAIVVHDPRVCHDLDSVISARSRWRSIIAEVLVWPWIIILVRPWIITSLLGWIWIILIDFRYEPWCVMILTKGHISKFSHIRCKCSHNLCPGLNNSLESRIWMKTIIVHNQRVRNDIVPRSYLEGKGHSTCSKNIMLRRTFHWRIELG